MKRQSGILLHVSSLPSDYGIGSFGRGAYELVDLLAESGFSIWQVLPFCVTDEYHSPYKSRASLGVNPYFIDLDLLAEEGLLTERELQGARQHSPYLAEYGRLERERLPLLAKAAARVKKSQKKKAEVLSFVASHAPFGRACEFLALSRENGGAPWQTWRTHTPDPDTLFLWQFIHYEFYRQWHALKSYANEKGISIIGDLPMYVDLDSADVYFAPHLFRLDGEGYPTAVAGVPPDAFAADGQLWRNPLYNYTEMARDGFAFWRERLGVMLELFDGVRIDHFRAFESYWSVPVGAASAREGHWVDGPREPLIDVIREVASGKLIIAEDLGVITDEVKELVRYSGFPGMRVLQFGFAEGCDNPHLPHNYNEHTVAYTGTHDNNTALGYLFEISDWERRRLLEYCAGGNPDGAHAVREMVKTVLRSSAATAIFPIQDILGYGGDTRMNTPGVATGNWEYRITREQLSAIDRKYWKEQNALFAR